jgi:hypothetical protein
MIKNSKMQGNAERIFSNQKQNHEITLLLHVRREDPEVVFRTHDNIVYLTDLIYIYISVFNLNHDSCNHMHQHSNTTIRYQHNKEKNCLYSLI